MRILLQRVREASVVIDGKVEGKIDQGLLIFLGIHEDDTEEDIDWLVRKSRGLRIFADAEGKMNRAVEDLQNPQALVISQFTLCASTKKGKRPSYISAAKPEKAILLYEKFVSALREYIHVETGIFGADMQVSLINDGPVTIWMDTQNKE